MACQLAIFLELNIDPDKLERLKQENWVVKDIRRRDWLAVIHLDKSNLLRMKYILLLLDLLFLYLYQGLSFMTNRQSFFVGYKLLESSVKEPVSDVIFDSMQPLNITDILVREYESEVNYATPKIKLLHIFYDLCNLTKAVNNGVDIRFDLVEIETRLTYIHQMDTKAFYYPNDEWFSDTYKQGSSSWRDSAYCFSMFHACQLFLYRMHMHTIYNAHSSTSNYHNNNNRKFSDSLLSDVKFENYYDLLSKSAILLSKFGSALAKLDFTFVIIDFCLNLIQCNGALLIMASILQAKDEIDRFKDIMNIVQENIKCIRYYQGLYGHLSLILKELEDINDQLLFFDNRKGQIQLVFTEVHECLDLSMPLHFGRDISHNENSFKLFDDNNHPNYPNSMTDVQILNDIFKKFVI